MCGIFGLIRPRNAGHPPDDGLLALAIECRDRMTHRGPDSHGLWSFENLALAHRRLMVIDPTDAGAQPMRSARGTLVYNGELYNDTDLRASLDHDFRTRSDTETLLAFLDAKGRDALPLLRGMYALAYFNTADRTLLIARDPLGIKPLYYTRAEPGGFAFASEIAPLLHCPGITREPDPVVLRAYLSTIRTPLGPRTCYEDIRTLRPGEWILIALDQPDRALASGTTPLPPAPEGTTRDIVRASIRAHLRSDVPMCSLLSGGLDSSIIALETMQATSSLRTYCSGARTETTDLDDFRAARAVAAALATDHTEAPVTRELFIERWHAMTRASQIPMSTPNEVAINHVARTLRAAGNVVALSGEG
ncbi:MAG: asparagine synthetase B family protein, partial [Phycisphaerales bacterium]